MIDALDALPSPRMIKSHLPAYLLPKELWTVQPKIIYTSRDAKDVAISSYHMRRNNVVPYTGTMSEFFADFYEDTMMFGPFYEHISSFHQLRHLDHLLLMTYEAMIANTFESIKCVSEFLECSYSYINLSNTFRSGRCEKNQNSSCKKQRSKCQVSFE